MCQMVMGKGARLVLMMVLSQGMAHLKPFRRQAECSDLPRRLKKPRQAENSEMTVHVEEMWRTQDVGPA